MESNAILTSEGSRSISHEDLFLKDYLRSNLYDCSKTMYTLYFVHALVNLGWEVRSYMDLQELIEFFYSTFYFKCILVDLILRKYNIIMVSLGKKWSKATFGIRNRKPPGKAG